MRRLRLHYLFIFIFGFFGGLPPSSYAATTTSSSQAPSCVPHISDVSGSVTLEFNCPVSVTNRFSYSIDSAGVSFLKDHYDITVSAVHHFFNEINQENVPPYQVEKRLETLAVEIRRLRARTKDLDLDQKTRPFIDAADKALDDGDIPSAVVSYKKAIQEADDEEKSAVETLYFIARTRTATAELLILQLKYGDARDVIKAGISNLPAALAGQQAVMLTVYSEALWFGGGGPEAIQAATEALDSFRKIGDTSSSYYIKALAVKLRAYAENGNLRSAKRLFFVDLLPLINSEEYKGSDISILCFSCMGEVFIKNKDADSAIQVLTAGISASKNKLIPDDVALASTYHNLAAAYGLSNNNEKMKEAQKKAVEYAFKAYPNGMHPDFAELFYTAATMEDDEDRKISYATKAIEIRGTFDPLEAPAYRDLLERCLSIGAAYLTFDPKSNTYVIGDGVPGNANDAQIGGGPNYQKFVEAMFATHMRNVRKYGDQPERVAYGIDDFAEALYQDSQKILSHLYLKKTLEYMKDKGENKELCGAYYSLANDRRYDHKEIEFDLQNAVRVCTDTYGAVSQPALDASYAYEQFLISANDYKGAARTINKLIADNAPFFESADGKKIKKRLLAALRK